jgi:hypothetical protein
VNYKVGTDGCPVQSILFGVLPSLVDYQDGISQTQGLSPPPGYGRIAVLALSGAQIRLSLVLGVAAGSRVSVIK